MKTYCIQTLIIKKNKIKIMNKAKIGINQFIS